MATRWYGSLQNRLEENRMFCDIWKTSKCFDEESVKTIVGTVKEHSEFRDVKQTVLTRCKVAC